MYAYDYYYTYWDGKEENTRGNAETEEMLASSWLKIENDNWLIDVDIYGFSIDSISLLVPYSAVGGSIGNSLPNNSKQEVRSVFYLSSNVKIKSGNGSKTNPYILNIN